MSKEMKKVTVNNRKFRLLKNTNFEWGKPVDPNSSCGFKGHRYAVFVFVPTTINNVIIEGWAPAYPFNAKTNTDALIIFNKYIESYDVKGEKLNDYYKVIKEKSN